MATTLRGAESHFAFGENWRSFSAEVTEERVEAAEQSLLRLLPRDVLRGASLLDIGCGSGLFSLAALRLGVGSLLAVDIDPVCVQTTREVLQRLPTRMRPNVEVRLQSVFDLRPEDGDFDVVYAWGVLHHTGDMRSAMHCASQVVRPGGMLAVAVYRRTPMCPFWRVEKRFYSRAPAPLQRLTQAAYRLALAAVNPSQLKTRQRGMLARNDIHDWLGGFPYESVRPAQMRHLTAALGLEIVAENVKEPGLGIFGSGCDEYVARRANA